MRLSLAKKIVSVTLAVAMVLGEAGTALAGTTNLTVNDINSQGAALATAGDATPAGGADSAATSTACISSFSITEPYYNSEDLEVSASVYGASYKLTVNGTEVSCTSNTYGNYKYISATIPVSQGVKYTIKLEAYDSDGNAVTQTKTYTRAKNTLTEFTVSNSVTGNSSGGRTYNGVNLYWSTKKDIYTHFRIYRSTKASSGYKSVGSVTGCSTWYYYTDDTAVPGKTYYYKLCVETGTNTYVKTSKILVKTGARKIAAGALSGTANFSLAYTKSGVEIDIYSYYGDSSPNQYDVYRPTKKYSGFKKIKTVYDTTYVDKTAKAGKVYYYKIVPKCYYTNKNKVVSGKASAAAGIKTVMGSLSVTTKQASKTAIKVSWDKVAGANLYEVWIQNTNLSGDAYKKVTTTKAASVTLKKLSATGCYNIKVYAIKKTNGIVKYMKSSTAYYVEMGYSSYVSNAEVKATKTNVSSDKKTVVTYSRIGWDVDWGASGYIIKAYNNYTGDWDTIKKITSYKTNSYVFKNTTTATKGTKYGSVTVSPYKAGVVGSSSWVYTNSLANIAKVKVARKDGNTVKITWSKVNGATKYYVYRKSASDGYTNYVGEATGTSILDTGISTGVKYEYYVYAEGTVTNGGSSSTVYSESTYSAAYTHKISTPVIAKIANSKSKSATLKWNAVAKANYYVVYRSTSKNGKYTKVATVKSTSRTYTDTKLAKGKTYYYKIIVKAIGENGSTTLSKASAAKGIKISK